MPGYLTPAQMQQARSAPPAQFDDLFIRLMMTHHVTAAGSSLGCCAVTRTGIDFAAGVLLFSS
jgi:hypothetical protein